MRLTHIQLACEYPGCETKTQHYDSEYEAMKAAARAGWHIGSNAQDKDYCAWCWENGK